jgi:hypothetical protein
MRHEAPLLVRRQKIRSKAQIRPTPSGARLPPQTTPSQWDSPAAFASEVSVRRIRHILHARMAPD